MVISLMVLGQSLWKIGLLRRLRRLRRVQKVRKDVQYSKPLNVIIGAGNTHLSGWIVTDLDVFDITWAWNWQALFEPQSIDRLLAEHVLEHLDETACKTALMQSFRYLKPGGLFRIAVPDGYRRDAEYLAEVTPPNDGHQILFTVDSLIPLLENVGFRVTPLEYFDVNEEFHACAWNPADGYIHRSSVYDKQQRFKRGGLFYTSLIIDARKPE